MERKIIQKKYQPVNCKVDIHPFLLGLARLFDFTGHLSYPEKKTVEDVDRESLKSDLIVIDEDFRKVIRENPVITHG